MKAGTIEAFVLFGLITIVFWAGASTNDPNIIYWDYIKDILTFSFSGFTLYLAYRALDRWQVQHAYVERYKAIIALEHSAFELDESLKRLQHCFNAKYQLSHEESDQCPEWQKVAHNFESALKCLQEQLSYSSRELRRYKTFLSKEEARSITELMTGIPGITFYVHGYIDEIRAQINSEFTVNSNDASEREGSARRAILNYSTKLENFRNTDISSKTTKNTTNFYF
jgi:hypothetical protein